MGGKPLGCLKNSKQWTGNGKVQLEPRAGDGAAGVMSPCLGPPGLLRLLSSSEQGRLLLRVHSARHGHGRTRGLPVLLCQAPTFLPCKRLWTPRKQWTGQKAPRRSAGLRWRGEARQELAAWRILSGDAVYSSPEGSSPSSPRSPTRKLPIS